MLEVKQMTCEEYYLSQGLCGSKINRPNDLNTGTSKEDIYINNLTAGGIMLWGCWRL